jgi:hypothetical protein
MTNFKAAREQLECLLESWDHLTAAVDLQRCTLRERMAAQMLMLALSDKEVCIATGLGLHRYRPRLE